MYQLKMEQKFGTEVDGNIEGTVNFKTLDETRIEFIEWKRNNGYQTIPGEQKDIAYNGKAKFRGWFMTINNPTIEDWEALDKDNYQYIVGQCEVGKNGTAHIQCFIYYTNPRVKPVKKYPRAWIDKAESFQASMKYCKKSETRIAGPFRKGEEPAQGKRSDLDELAKKVIEGATMDQMAQEHPGDFIKYSRGLIALQDQVTKHRTEKPQVMWLWGEAGTGKTRWVFDRWEREKIYVKDGTMWWNGYTQQEVILIDDFDGKWPYRDFLRLLDRNPYQGQTKGGFVKINSPVIIITCEFHPREVYGKMERVEDGVNDFNKSDNHLRQVMRRIDEIGRLTGKECGEPPMPREWSE